MISLFEEDPPCLGYQGYKDILLALKFELTQKYSASKSQHY